MSESRLENHLKRQRKAAGLSQNALAERVGVSRQAILAVEAGRNVPSTSLGLRLAYALGCSVEDIFQLAPAPGIHAHLAPAAVGNEGGARVAAGKVAGRWVAHRLPSHGILAADGTISGTDGDMATVTPLVSSGSLRRNVLVAGCAPLLGAVATRVGQRFNDARVTWLPTGNRNSMRLLAGGLVHVAGLHLAGEGNGSAAEAVARKTLPGQRLLLVNLTGWRIGVVVPAGNPLGLASGADLMRPGLRLAHREKGCGAHAVASRHTEGACDEQSGPHAAGHREVARMVRSGAADAGIAIESAALAEGLDFIPLASERFDLVIPADVAADSPVSRLIETLDDPAFRTEIEHLPGYDGSRSGQVTTVDAA